MTDINDKRTIKNFSFQKNGYTLSSNLILIPTPELLSTEQFEHTMTSESIIKMMARKGDVKEIMRIKFNNFIRKYRHDSKQLLFYIFDCSQTDFFE